jgi:hypothetical protein
MKKEPFGSFFCFVFKGTNSFIVLQLCVWVNLSFSLWLCFFEGTISFINPDALFL